MSTNPSTLEQVFHPQRSRDEALRILARTLVRELRSQGFELRHVIALSGELLEAVTVHVRPQPVTAEETR